MLVSSGVRERWHCNAASMLFILLLLLLLLLLLSLLLLLLRLLLAAAAAAAAAAIASDSAHAGVTVMQARVTCSGAGNALEVALQPGWPCQ